MSEASERRFFVDVLSEEGGEVELTAEIHRHARVLRLAVGDRISLFDGSGREASARITSLDPAICVAGAPEVAAPDPPRAHLIQALPKGKKLDGIVRMTTELGVDEIHLALSERSISRPDEGRFQSKTERLLRVAREASRQSRRRTVPAIRPPRPLDSISREAPDDALRLVFWEHAAEPLPKTFEETSEVWVVVGPEGGLSHMEVARLEERGFRPLRLGPTTLRVETAAVAGLALVLERVGRFRR